MSRSPDSFRVGDVFIAGSYVVTPTDVANHHRARQLAEMMEQPGDGGSRSVAAATLGAPCPAPLLISGALSRLRSTGAFRELRMEFQSPTRFKTLAAPVVGEPIQSVATVRYRSRNHGGSVFLTLGVELRRRRGGTLATFEIGVELAEEPGHGQAEADAGRSAA
jgi:hypothetical protein